VPAADAMDHVTEVSTAPLTAAASTSDWPALRLDDKGVMEIATGSTGEGGSVGVGGAVGATGAVGAAGVAGAVGAAGVAGAVGVLGAVGAAGVVGAMGAMGAVGMTGTVGVVGVAGTDGAAGVVGDDPPEETVVAPAVLTGMGIICEAWQPDSSSPVSRAATLSQPARLPNAAPHLARPTLARSSTLQPPLALGTDQRLIIGNNAA
jgi:hypothetical protein